jgi:hypothetical protein
LTRARERPLRDDDDPIIRRVVVDAASVGTATTSNSAEAEKGRQAETT